MKSEGLPQKREPSLEGEIISPKESDPIIDRQLTEKLNDLPKPVAEWWLRIKPSIRRVIVSDEYLLNKTHQELIDIFTYLNPEYQTLDEQLGIKKHPLEKSDNASRLFEDPLVAAKDITPKNHTPKKVEYQKKLE